MKLAENFCWLRSIEWIIIILSCLLFLDGWDFFDLPFELLHFFFFDVWIEFASQIHGSWFIAQLHVSIGAWTRPFFLRFLFKAFILRFEDIRLSVSLIDTISLQNNWFAIIFIKLALDIVVTWLKNMVTRWGVMESIFEDFIEGELPLILKDERIYCLVEGFPVSEFRFRR